MTSPSFNLTSYDAVEVTFYFYSYSMENNEDFWLRFYNGSSWATVGTWARGTSFENNTFYSATVVLNSSDVNFSSNSAFRFQNDASGNNDHIYIDQVTINGITGDGGVANSISAISNNNSNFSLNSSSFNGDEMVYPNPAINILNINPNFGTIKSTYRITNVLGQVITSGTIKNNSVNISILERGIYLIELTDEEGCVASLRGGKPMPVAGETVHVRTATGALSSCVRSRCGLEVSPAVLRSSDATTPSGPSGVRTRRPVVAPEMADELRESQQAAVGSKTRSAGRAPVRQPR
jgi:hypothetical protein